MSGNDKNRQFYNAVPLEVFQSLTKQGGFDQYVDLKLIEQHIASDAKVMEVGAGFGRCIDFLLTKKHQGNIWAIEQSEQLYNVLTEKYKDSTSVTLIHTDIKSMKQAAEVNVILWLFSGALDFGKEEQPVVLKQLRSFLSKDGKLFVDIPQLAELTVAKYTTAQDIFMETPYGNITSYIPSFEEMEAYAKQSGFSRVEVIHYQTDTDKKRSMYTLSV